MHLPRIPLTQSFGVHAPTEPHLACAIGNRSHESQGNDAGKAGNDTTLIANRPLTPDVLDVFLNA